MATNNTQTSRELYQALWNSADILRSKMDANDYKSYLLGLIFYKFLSDKLLYSVAENLDEEVENLQQAQKLYEEAMADEDTKEDLVETLKDDLSYIILPELTFTALVNNVNEGTFQLESLSQGFRNMEQEDETFENLFEDIDLYSKN